MVPGPLGVLLLLTREPVYPQPLPASSHTQALAVWFWLGHLYTHPEVLSLTTFTQAGSHGLQELL